MALQATSEESAPEPRGHGAEPIVKQASPFNRRKKSGRYRPRPENSSDDMLSRMSEKMSVHAIGGYISETSSAPLKEGVINGRPPSPVSSTPRKGKGRKGATAGGRCRGGRRTPITCEPCPEKPALPEDLLQNVSAPEKRARLPDTDHEGALSQPLPKIVSQESIQTSQSLRSVQQGKLVWRYKGSRALKSEKMVAKWCMLPVTLMMAIMTGLCVMAPVAAFFGL
jgi:hypothetical protein